MTYAIGNQFNLFAPVCTGEVDCASCDGAQVVATNNTRLLWKALGLVGGLVTGIFGYAYLTAKDNNTSSAQPVTNNEALQDDFFDFDDNEKVATPSTQVISDNKNNETEETVEIDEFEDGTDDVSLAAEIENSETTLPEAQLSEAFLS